MVHLSQTPPNMSLIGAFCDSLGKTFLTLLVGNLGATGRLRLNSSLVKVELIIFPLFLPEGNAILPMTARAVCELKLTGDWQQGREARGKFGRSLCCGHSTAQYEEDVGGTKGGDIQLGIQGGGNGHNLSRALFFYWLVFCCCLRPSYDLALSCSEHPVLFNYLYLVSFCLSLK